MTESEKESLIKWCRTLGNIWSDFQEGRDTSQMYGYSNMEDAIFHTEKKVRAICKENGEDPDVVLCQVYPDQLNKSNN